MVMLVWGDLVHRQLRLLLVMWMLEVVCRLVMIQVHGHLAMLVQQLQELGVRSR